MGYEGRPQKLEEKMGALYSLGIDRSVKKHLSGISISNGLAWTEDNQTMFYIDSIPRKIYAFNFDLEEGEISEITLFLPLVYAIKIILQTYV